MFYEYNEEYNEGHNDKIRLAILDSVKLRGRIRIAGAAYSALVEYRDRTGDECDATFNKYFEVSPTATLRNGVSLEEDIRHGLILTCPNVPDESLPAHALEARERAITVALAAARNVAPTRASAAASAGGAGQSRGA